MGGCFFEHNWGWPRKRGDKQIQTCTVCGCSRESKIQFDGPRYVLTRPGRTQLPASATYASLEGLRKAS
jgi:hypothetical protein